jgi:SAM-dependent methyltransferase
MAKKRSNTQNIRINPRIPKRTGNEHPIHINWFPYYAGYNSDFVHDVLKSLNLQTSDTILDPWNGSGTTTTTAYRFGTEVIGCDINPVMVIAAKSALLDPGAARSLIPLADEILNAASGMSVPAKNDPLATWYIPSSAIELRRIHWAAWKILVDSYSTPSLSAVDISNLSTLAAFFLTALMRTARHFLAPFVGSNPTWIRKPLTHAHRIRPAKDRMIEYFRMEVRRMATLLENAGSAGLREPAHGKTPTISVEPSTLLPFESSSIEAVISSPPYLTRIDYAIATKPELAALGMRLEDDFDKLRKAMIGAPTVRSESSHMQECFGPSCDTFLKAVRQHPSKGSQNYYHKLFVQYFTDMAASLSEITRLLRKSGTCVLVVQDSYYKELHANLARYVSEMAEQSGLSVFDRHEFNWNRNMVRVNSRARKYRDSTDAVESVLWLKHTA